MRLSSLALSLLLLGSSPSFAAGAELEKQEGKVRLKLGELNIGENNVFLNVEAKLTPDQISRLRGASSSALQDQLSRLQAEMSRIMQLELVRLLEESHIAQATQESLESHLETSSKADEGQKLLQLFGQDIDQHEDIQEIRALLESGTLIKKNAPPRFFDGLFYVIEDNLELCKKVKEVNICLEKNQSTSYKKNLYKLHSVLNFLIINSQIEKLTLNFFEPKTLVASLSTLKLQKGLKYIDLRFNSLETRHFDLVLRSFPSGGNIIADFSDNKIDDEEFLSSLLSETTKLKSLTILQQAHKRLDAKIISQCKPDQVHLEIS
jgi:hypothetical protein